MASIKWYTILFVALSVITTVQYGLEVALIDEYGEGLYWVAFGLVLTLSTVKAVGVAAWYMHLRDEPRAITYIAIAGLTLVFALIAGAAYSVT